ncbi:MAG: GTPase HflX [Xanthomonadales bacterium]|nr:GTPase HflX [Xanthomonadales bacterium]
MNGPVRPSPAPDSTRPDPASDPFSRARRGERALLLIPLRQTDDADAETAEFSELARSAGAEVVATVTARVQRPHPATYVGEGKVEEVAALREAEGCDLVLVDHPLSPVQERNLERLCKCRVLDRTGLILDIFAQRARSFEGKLQVELAQLRHMATRLVRGWTHLERQRGGSIGLRGPGETQLETDRRLLAERVKILRRRLEQVQVQRGQSRRARSRGELPTVALVGYTNAGKSTLFNRLTGAGVYAADQLFATLDPTLRRIEGLSCGPLLLADTVGFIRELPHEVVAAFRSTLAEARDADLLLHVVDAADPEHPERIRQVDAVLEEIGAGDLPRILVMNKVDSTGQPARADAIDGGDQPRVWLSAATGQGIDLLFDALAGHFAALRSRYEVFLPHQAASLRAALFRRHAVESERATEAGWLLTTRLGAAELGRLQGERSVEGLRVRALPD